MRWCKWIRTSAVVPRRAPRHYGQQLSSFPAIAGLMPPVSRIQAVAHPFHPSPALPTDGASAARQTRRRQSLWAPFAVSPFMVR